MLKNNKKKVFRVTAVCLALVSVGSFGYVGYKQYFEPKTKDAQYEEIRKKHKNNEFEFQNDSKTENEDISNYSVSEKDESSSEHEPDDTSRASVSNDVTSENSKEDLLSSNIIKPTMQEQTYTFEYTDRTFGWISVPGTSIDYPVLYMEGDNDYYLTHNYAEQYDSYGSIYLDGNQYIGAKNMTLYGHNINAYYNSMFRPLVNYENEYFFDSHPIIEFDYDSGSSEWEVIGCMIADLQKDHVSFTKCDFLDDNDFLDYGNSLLENCTIRKDGVELRADDELLTLATCSYHTNDCRTIVICRRI